MLNGSLESKSDTVTTRPGDLFEDLPRGIPGKAAPPTARFADLQELKRSHRLRYENGKILIGAINCKIREKVMPSGRVDYSSHGGIPIAIDDDRHGMVVSSSGGGKDRCFGKGFLHTYPGQVFVPDFKGDMSIGSAWRSAHTDNKQAVLDPFNFTQAPKHCRAKFNFINILLPGNPYQIENAKVLAEGLVASDIIQESYWVFAARDFGSGLPLHIATHPNYEGRRNLKTMRLALTGRLGILKPTANPQDPRPRDWDYSIDALLEEMKNNPACEGYISGIAIQMQERAEKERAAVVSTLRTATSWLDSPQMQEIVSESTFTDDEDVDEYIAIPPRFAPSCMPFIRMRLLYKMHALMERKAPPKYKPTFLLQEYHMLKKIELIEEAAALMREYFRIIWMVQDYNQLADIHGNERWQSLLANCSWTICFGSNDNMTLETLTRKFGQTSVVTRSQSDTTTNAKFDGAKGESSSIQFTNLLDNAELNRFTDRGDPQMRMLFLMTGKNPAWLHKINYDSHEIFEPVRAWYREHGYHI